MKRTGKVLIIIIVQYSINNLPSFLVTSTMVKPQYTQKFRVAWLKDPALKEWLQEISSTTGSVAKCKLCHCALVNKYSDLKNHAQTKKHKANANLVLGKTQPKIPFVKENLLTAAKLAECRLCLFVACHTSLLTTDHLVDLCRNTFKGRLIVQNVA